MTISDRQNSNKKHEFTRSEWLVRIFLYSCVTATVAISFKVPYLFVPGIEQADRAEAKQTIERINRVLQVSYIEDGKFVNFKSFDIDNLGLEIKTETENYRFRILSPMIPVQTLNESEDSATRFEQGMVAIAQAKKPKLNQYIGAVFLSQAAGTNTEAESITGICMVNAGVPLPSTLPRLINGEIECPAGTELLR